MRTKFDYSLIPPAPDLSFEVALWNAGVRCVAGIDEAGRGALAGPVAAGAIILPVDDQLASKLKGVRDSKQMTPRERSAWAARLPSMALTWAVGFASALEIDEIGILPATRLAVQRALEKLTPTPQHLLLDYLQLPECSLPQTALIKGDARSLSIAAASILAKTARDKVLCQLEQEYPGYGFAAHKGYGTAAHILSIQHLGFSQAHRHSFQIHQLGEI
jgi:ribonuclease HII